MSTVLLPSEPLPAASQAPMSLLAAAIEGGVDPDKLGKLMDLVEKWQHMRAAEAFGAALAKFQAECPPVVKRRTASGTKFAFQFASLDDVMKQAGPVLARCGLAISFDSEHVADNGAASLKITIRVRVGSYFEDRTFTCPVPKDLHASQPQQYGAALSFAKRYALCAALNIVVTDEDNDAAGLLDNVTPEQIEQLNDLIVEKGVDLDRFLAWAGVESLDKMPQKDFAKAIDLLKRKSAKGGAK